MASVLVTGANGHLGSNVVRSLLNRGHRVVAFVRRGADLQGLDSLPVKYFYGDIVDEGYLEEAAQDCEVIIHSAAVYRLWAKDPDEILQPALKGTQNLFNAAAKASVRRIVCTSSVAAVGYAAAPDSPRTEADWNDEARNPYFVAKTRAEKEAWRLSTELELPTIVLCPTTVLGPYDYKITPSTQLILDLINGKGQTFEGGLNIVDVRNVAEAHAAAVEKGEPGKRYIVGGTNMTWKELGDLIGRLTGVTPRHLKTGRGLSMAFAGIVEFFAKLTGSKPPFTRDIVHETVERYGYFDSENTNSTFGLATRGAEEVLRDCIRWLLFQNRIKSSLAEKLAEKFSPDPEWDSVPPQEK